MHCAVGWKPGQVRGSNEASTALPVTFFTTLCYHFTSISPFHPQYVPVTYVSHTSFLETFLNWAPSLVTTGILLLVARANMSALRGGGSGERGYWG